MLEVLEDDLAEAIEDLGIGDVPDRVADAVARGKCKLINRDWDIPEPFAVPSMLLITSR